MNKLFLFSIFLFASLISFGQTYDQELVIKFTNNPSNGQSLTIGSCLVTFSGGSGDTSPSCSSNSASAIYIRSTLSQTLNESRPGYAQGFKQIQDFSDSTHGDITMAYDNDKTFTFTSSSSTNSKINFVNSATSSVTEVSNTVESTLSVPEYQTRGVILSPNPVYDKLFISSPKEITSISIYSIFGQKVYASSPLQNDFEVDISFIPRGIYLVKAKTKLGNKTMKIRKE